MNVLLSSCSYISVLAVAACPRLVASNLLTKKVRRSYIAAILQKLCTIFMYLKWQNIPRPHYKTNELVKNDHNELVKYWC